MTDLRFEKKDESLTIFLCGRIAAENASATEGAVQDVLREQPAKELILDCDALEYISSAGLRVLLRLKKSNPSLTLVNVSPDVYEILEMTGFTELLTVRKAYRKLSLAGCEVIGEGANGKVVRIDPETVLKAYYDPEALPEITKERELARTAFLLGIPTAIPYDVVRIEGGGYGSVFELLNAESLGQLLDRGAVSVEDAARRRVELLKQIHGTVAPAGKLPTVRPKIEKRARILNEILPGELYQKLLTLLAELPDDEHMLHGDFHVKNILVQQGELLLIDMDTLCHGHPIFELAFMYSAYRGFPESEGRFERTFMNIDYKLGRAFWERSLQEYLGTDDPARLKAVEAKAQIISCTRILGRAVLRLQNGKEVHPAAVPTCRQHLLEQLPRIDSLTF